MTALPPVLWAIRSPAQSVVAGDIVLFRQTWIAHIKVFHEPVELWQLQDNLSDPCYIAASTTEPPGNVLFICEGNTDDYGAPLVVAVRTLPNGSNIVTSAYYDERYERHQPKLWERGDG